MGSSLGRFFLFGAIAGLFAFAAGLVTFLAALAVLVARGVLGAFFVFAAALLGGGSGGIRRGGFLGVAVEAECEGKGCYSEDFLNMIYCLCCWCNQ